MASDGWRLKPASRTRDHRKPPAIEFAAADPSRRGSKRRWVAIVLAAAAVAGVVGLGSVRRPYGVVESGAPVRPPVTTAGETAAPIRVATFNIHSGRGRDGRRNLAATAAVLRSVGLAGLNEVRGPTVFGGADQAAELGARLGLAGIFGPSERRWYVTSFGNGLLSRFPIRSWRSQPLENGRRQTYRAVILAEVGIGAVSLRLLVAHPERGTLRDAQLREIRALFAGMAAPALLLGDLNATLRHPLLSGIHRLPNVVHALAGNIDPAAASRAIDHIYVKGMTVRAAGITPTLASDHPLVWAELGPM